MQIGDQLSYLAVERTQATHAIYLCYDLPRNIQSEYPTIFLLTFQMFEEKFVDKIIIIIIVNALDVERR